MTAQLKSAVFYMGCDDTFEERRDTVTCKPCAVVVRNATKCYTSGVSVLNKLNMTVEQGTIYTLLGASGCGKSTLLNCIVGLGKLTSGDIWLFGKKGRDCGIPGKSVGFMPQDYSLYKDFSINETFVYFGILHGMDACAISNAMMFYSKLLNLPQPNLRVGSLSGGQKRRVSIAVAMIHDPELLVLDEPTVGCDALVRERIWEHLVERVTKNNTTIIITTHYTDEARWSNKVGIMRNGRLLAENCPTALLHEYGTSSLESAVLKLCRQNECITDSTATITTTFEKSISGQFKRKSITDHVAGLEQTSSSADYDKSILPSMSLIEPKKSSAIDCCNRIEALVKKNIFLMFRNFTMLIIIIFVPCAGMFTTFIADGNDPSNIHFGVVNAELNNSISCEQMSSFWNGTCDMYFLSCKFMKHLYSPTFDLINFDSMEEAEKAVRLGEIWGFVFFPEDYSYEFYQRGVAGIDVNVADFNKSDIIVRMDETSTIIARQLKFALYKVFQKYVKELLRDCEIDPRVAEHSLKLREPIYGIEGESFRDFLIPSNFIGYMFFYPIITAGIRYVNEKREGTMERSLVAGVKMWEIFLAYSFCEFVIALIRTFIFYTLAVWIFGMKIIGSLSLQFLLGILETYMGVGAGFFIGAFCTEEIQVALLAMALFFPNSVLSGMIWNLEGMPQVLQTIAYFLPCTLACESMRSMACRGWEFSHPNVWPGFAASFGYMMVFFVAAVFISSRKFIK